jgi:cell division protein FtsL
MAIEVFCEKRINNAALHHDVDADQRRQYFLLVGLAGLFMVGLLVYGWQQYQWVQSGYEIETAQKQRDDLAEYRKQLLVERASMANPERIDKIARTRLGMTLPAPGQVVALGADAPALRPVDPIAAPPELTASKR